MDQLAQLEASEAIKALKARYFRALDTKDWEAFASVFADDVRLEVPEAQVELVGRDAVVEAVSSVLLDARTVHHGHTCEIDVVSDSVATGIWAMEDYVEYPPTDQGRVGLRGYGHYHERYVVERGEWRIASSRLERLRIDPVS